MHRDTDIAVFEKALASLEEARVLITALKEQRPRPADDPAVEKARRMIREIRDGLDAGAEIQKVFRDVRDSLAAALYGAAPELGVESIAHDIGTASSSLVTRTALRKGEERRTNRSAREAPDPEAQPAGKG